MDLFNLCYELNFFDNNSSNKMTEIDKLFNLMWKYLVKDGDKVTIKDVTLFILAIFGLSID